MPFDIPDNDVATHADQSRWMSTDIDILVAGLAGVGVVSGCGVTAQGSPDMTVAIAAGTIRIASGGQVAVTSGNGTITAADATNPRIDLVSASDTGTKTVTAGTANATPKSPALPSGHVALAMVYVPANDTTISSGQITDKRVMTAGFLRSAVLSPSSDTYIAGPSTGFSNTNYDGAGDLEIADLWSSTTWGKHALMTFDVSSLAGSTILLGQLQLALALDGQNSLDADTAIPLEVRKVLRAYTPTGVTWNKYDGTNNWTTAGAHSEGNDVEGVVYAAGNIERHTSTNESFHVVDLARMLQVEADAASTTLRIIIGTRRATTGQNPFKIRSLDHATASLRPKLRVVCI